MQTTDFSFYWRNIISFEQDKAMLLERLHKRKAPGLAAQWLQLQSWKQKQQEFEDYIKAQGQSKGQRTELPECPAAVGFEPGCCACVSADMLEVGHAICLVACNAA